MAVSSLIIFGNSLCGLAGLLLARGTATPLELPQSFVAMVLVVLLAACKLLALAG
ncbi:MAG: hypothetical protein VKO00_09110 [Cyanobacteriota bacterium]|nr:hypothetical protein [Cyanobacteriota bacterium]